MEKIFEKATRMKLRFPFRGSITTEDLWDLSPENLDVIFKKLAQDVKKSEAESLLKTKTEEDERLEVSIETVKYIFAVKQEEAELRKQAIERKHERAKIKSIIAKKQDAVLEGKSEEELKKMLDALED